MMAAAHEHTDVWQMVRILSHLRYVVLPMMVLTHRCNAALE